MGEAVLFQLAQAAAAGLEVFLLDGLTQQRLALWVLAALVAITLPDLAAATLFLGWCLLVEVAVEAAMVLEPLDTWVAVGEAGAPLPLLLKQAALPTLERLLGWSETLAIQVAVVGQA